MTGQNISIEIFWLTILIQKFEILFWKDFLFDLFFLFLGLLFLFLLYICVGWEALILQEEILLGWVNNVDMNTKKYWVSAFCETNLQKFVFTLTALLKARFDGLQETGGTTEDIWRPASFPWGFAQVTSLPYWTLLVNISQLNHLEGTTRCFALGILSGRITFQLELKNIPNLSWNQLNSLQLHCFQPHLSKTPLFCHLYPVQWKCKSFLEV